MHVIHNLTLNVYTTYFALQQTECCVEWGEHAVSLSLPSASENPVGMMEDVFFYSEDDCNNTPFLETNIHTSVHFWKELCVSESAVTSGWSMFTFCLFRKPAFSKISLNRLLYPCRNHKYCISELSDSSFSENKLHSFLPLMSIKLEGNKMKHKTGIYLLSNKTFIASLLCLIPFALQLLTESRVDLKRALEHWIMANSQSALSCCKMSSYPEENVDGKQVGSQRSASTHRYWALRPGPACWLHHRQEVPAKTITYTKTVSSIYISIMESWSLTQCSDWIQHRLSQRH